jgi:hypothetical protein
MNSYKNNSEGSGKELADMQVKEDGVVGAVDDAEEEQGLVVTCTLTSYGPEGRPNNLPQPAWRLAELFF